MRRAHLTLLLALAGPTPAFAQIATQQIVPDGLRQPKVSPDALKAMADARLRADLDAARATIAQLQATIAKMQQQLDRTTNDAWLTRADLEKVAKAYLAHTHIVNGTVGVGLTSTVDGDKQVFRYVIPPYNNQDGLEARTTGAPVQPKAP